jgi:hypothetical protein
VLLDFKVSRPLPARMLVQVAIQCRRALLHLSDGDVAFAGRLDNHQHASFLPRISSGQIRNIEVHLPKVSLDSGRALLRLRFIKLSQQQIPLTLECVVEEPQAPPGIWISTTPFFGTTHVKRTRTGAPKRDVQGRVRGGTEHDVVRLLGLRNIAADVVQVEPWIPPDLRALDLRGLRGRRGNTPPSRVTLRTRSVHVGPLALGYGAHFGLGQFQWQRG